MSHKVSQRRYLIKMIFNNHILTDTSSDDFYTLVISKNGFSIYNFENSM